MEKDSYSYYLAPPLYPALVYWCVGYWQRCCTYLRLTQNAEYGVRMQRSVGGEMASVSGAVRWITYYEVEIMDFLCFR